MLIADNILPALACQMGKSLMTYTMVAVALNQQINSDKPPQADFAQ